MNQEERLDYLIEKLQQESAEYRSIKVPNSERRRVLRSLMNVRMPKNITNEFQTIQDQYLQEEATQKGIVGVEEIPTVKEQYGSSNRFADKISIWQGDITRLQVDAIVNAANSQMLGCFVPCHGCIDNVIHSASGIQLRNACHQYMTQKRQEAPNYEEPTGSAAITPGFNLPAKYVIHTVGPIVGWELTDSLRKDLVNCYESCLKIALENDIRSVAFCCISTGEFHFPNDEAAKIAVDTVTTFLDKHGERFERIIFNVFKDVDKVQYEGFLA